jgi:hypothetical protein
MARKTKKGSGIVMPVKFEVINMSGKKQKVVVEALTIGDRMWNYACAAENEQAKKDFRDAHDLICALMYGKVTKL